VFDKYVTQPARKTAWSAGHDCTAVLVHQREVPTEDGGTRVVVEPRTVTCRSEKNAEYPLTVRRTFARIDGDDRGERWAVTLYAGHRMLVPLGFKATLFHRVVGFLFVRSGLAWKDGITLMNGAGVIDADYPDEYMAMLWNTSKVNREIVHGERIAQLVGVRFLALNWVSGVVSKLTDRAGGVGSTGRGAA
jgi:dUTP pyrophosphatase